MPNEPTYRVIFKAEDIISAQRMRFLQSSKLKIIAALWGIAALWSSAALLLPEQIPPIPYVAPSTVLGSTLLFAMLVSIFYWLGPLIEFRTNILWKTPFQIQITAEHLMLLLEGRTKGAFIRWDQIRKVHANERAYILYTSSEDNFLILPRSVFPDPAAEGLFCAYLSTRSALKPHDKEKLPSTRLPR